MNSPLLYAACLVAEQNTLEVVWVKKCLDKDSEDHNKRHLLRLPVGTDIRSLFNVANQQLESLQCLPIAEADIQAVEALAAVMWTPEAIAAAHAAVDADLTAKRDQAVELAAQIESATKVLQGLRAEIATLQAG